MKVVRAILSVLVRIAVVAAAAVAVYRFSWIPYNCNRDAKTNAAMTLKALDASPVDASALAQRNLRIIDASLNRCGRDASELMLAAANYRLANQREQAIEAYRQALGVDQRPEIYLELGLTQLSVGNRREGVSNITRAARFAEQYMYEAGDPMVIDEVRANLGLPRLPR